MARMPRHPDDVKMSLGEHLEELRRRVLYSVIAVGAGMAVCLIFISPLINFLTAPVTEAVLDFQERASARAAAETGTGGEAGAGEASAPRASGEPVLVALSVTEVFVTAMKTALVAGLVLASPVVAYQMWLFVAAGLYPHERRVIHVFIPFSVLLFLAGTAFAYGIVLKYGLPLLLNFANLGTVARPMIPLSAAIGFVLMMSVVMGAVWQLPIVMMILARVGLAQPSTYVKYWRHATVGIFLTAAVLTPPDVFTQISMAGPMIGLYWLGVLLSRGAARKRLPRA